MNKHFRQLKITKWKGENIIKLKVQQTRKIEKTLGCYLQPISLSDIVMKLLKFGKLIFFCTFDVEVSMTFLFVWLQKKRNST